jgi:hypothetical protein
MHTYVKSLWETPTSRSATLGEELPGTLLTRKRPSPSAKSRALGEAFAECHTNSRGRFNTVGAI